MALSQEDAQKLFKAFMGAAGPRLFGQGAQDSALLSNYENEVSAIKALAEKAKGQPAVDPSNPDSATQEQRDLANAQVALATKIFNAGAEAGNPAADFRKHVIEATATNYKAEQHRPPEAYFNDSGDFKSDLSSLTTSLQSQHQGLLSPSDPAPDDGGDQPSEEAGNDPDPNAPEPRQDEDPDARAPGQDAPKATQEQMRYVANAVDQMERFFEAANKKSLKEGKFDFLHAFVAEYRQARELLAELQQKAQNGELTQEEFQSNKDNLDVLLRGGKEAASESNEAQRALQSISQKGSTYGFSISTGDNSAVCGAQIGLKAPGEQHVTLATLLYRMAKRPKWNTAKLASEGVKELEGQVADKYDGDALIAVRHGKGDNDVMLMRVKPEELKNMLKDGVDPSSRVFKQSDFKKDGSEPFVESDGKPMPKAANKIDIPGFAKQFADSMSSSFNALVREKCSWVKQAVYGSKHAGSSDHDPVKITGKPKVISIPTSPDGRPPRSFANQAVGGEGPSPDAGSGPTNG